MSMEARTPRARGLIALAGIVVLGGIGVIRDDGSGSAAAATGPVATKSAKLKLVNDSSLQLSTPNESPRAVALCPGGLEPYGGAQSASPPPAPDGEGVYPHS